MGVSVGPNLVSSNLTLAYDMSNTSKSWSGAPTTNLVDPQWANWSIDGSGQGSIGTRTITSPFACTITDVNANTRQNIYITTGISASTTYTFSVQYQRISGPPTLRFQIQAYNGASYISTMSFATTAQLGIVDSDDWQTAKITLTTPAGCNRILWFMQDGDDYTTYTHIFNLANVQCEQQSFATPFVAGTRSNTQAIIDMVDRRTITATSVTYNNDNTFTFTKASGNYLTMPLLSSGNTSVSVSCWAYVTLGTAGCIFVSGSGSGFGIGIGNNYYIASDPGNNVVGLFPAIRWISTGVSYSTTGWKNVVVTMDASAIPSIYLNGTLVGTYSGSAPLTPSTNSYIGRNIGDEGSATDRAFEGRIAHVTFYNKILTATEIKQNFEALRVRYGV